jgi:hypothetical protein
MSGSRLIGDYLAILSADLPGRIVDELADGLDETYRRYLGQSGDPEAAARSAVTEFGEPRVIVAAFADASRARKTARRLLAAGPVVGLGWASVLISARAWTWPVPVVPRVLFGLALITVIGLLAAATLSRQYRLVCRAAAAACVGTAILDAVMTGTVLVIAPALVWPITVAVVLSAGRSGFALRSVHHALTG